EGAPRVLEAPEEARRAPGDELARRRRLGEGRPRLPVDGRGQGAHPAAGEGTLVKVEELDVLEVPPPGRPARRRQLVGPVHAGPPEGARDERGARTVHTCDDDAARHSGRLRNGAML